MHLPDSTLFLCATARLAQALRRPPEQAGDAAPRTAPTPQAFTVGQWLRRLGEEMVLRGAAALPSCLDPYAERLLWEQIIAAGMKGGGQLFDLPGMAAAASEAHALTAVWLIAPQGHFLAEESRLFLAWQREFLRRCEARQWLDAARWQGRVVSALATADIPLPQTVTFAGFDRLTPLEEALRQTLAQRGVTVFDAAPVNAAAVETAACPCPDSLAECRAAAAWAAARLAKNPHGRLGIVAADLAAVRHFLEWALEDALQPEMIRASAVDAPRLYNFSLGQPVAELPIIRAALELLALTPSLGRGQRIPQGRFSALLLSPYWSAGDEEADARAVLDARMRQNLPHLADLQAVLRLARQNGVCPQSAAALEALARSVSQAGGQKRLPGGWAGVFRAWLAAAGWPGERALSSEEYQARRAFFDILEGFGGLDEVLGPVGRGEALRRLAQLCRERVFQPETKGRPAVQALGMLESAGLEFDALWVMGMNDHCWPPPPAPNPLLPAELQRAAALPRSGPAVEQAFAAAVQARLLKSAPDIVFSWSQSGIGGDAGRLLRPSPLPAGLALRPMATPTWPHAAVLPAPLERLADHLAPPAGEGEKISGGAGLLRAQALCPAWGFYQYRLGARALNTPVEGLDAAARGSLVHFALQRFWQQTRDQAALLALTAAARQTAIAEAAANALTQFEEERHLALPARFRQLEAERLCHLLALWLDLEAARPTPFAVAACEEEMEIMLEGIRVRLFIDRIDQLPDGRRIVIDYKTGRDIDTRNWAEERITEPQLPIYAAIAAPWDIAAVAFGKVLIDAPAFAGAAADSELLPGVYGLLDEKQRIFPPWAFPHWPAVMDHWRARLAAVALEVGQGEAGVRLADADALRHCEVLPLLRLAERQTQMEEAARP